MAFLVIVVRFGRFLALDVSSTSVIIALLWLNRMDGVTKEYFYGEGAVRGVCVSGVVGTGWSFWKV